MLLSYFDTCLDGLDRPNLDFFVRSKIDWKLTLSLSLNVYEPIRFEEISITLYGIFVIGATTGRCLDIGGNIFKFMKVA